MTEIISVRFKSGGKEYFFNPDGMTVAEGQSVIIETSKGVECAVCVKGNSLIDETELISPLRPVLRLATEQDLQQVEENRKKEERAFQICQEKILEHGLEMKLIEVEYSFDGSKILFFFTADGRVDFRGLVKDLASVFRTRIELRQIGVRDEAKMLGGLGICGRPFCCSAFLNDFHPVSIKMAKTQNLSLNPTKISGTCGRLMCCLKYEQDAYTDLLKRAPKQDSLVETPDGVGTVTQVNLLRETSKVTLDNDPEAPKVYHNCDLCVLRSGKGKRPAPEKQQQESAADQAQQQQEAAAPRPKREQQHHHHLENVILPAAEPAEAPAAMAAEEPEAAAVHQPAMQGDSEQGQPEQEAAAAVKPAAARPERGNRSQQQRGPRPNRQNRPKPAKAAIEEENGATAASNNTASVGAEAAGGEQQRPRGNRQNRGQRGNRPAQQRGGHHHPQQQNSQHPQHPQQHSEAGGNGASAAEGEGTTAPRRNRPHYRKHHR